MPEPKPACSSCGTRAVRSGTTLPGSGGKRCYKGLIAKGQGSLIFNILLILLEAESSAQRCQSCSTSPRQRLSGGLSSEPGRKFKSSSKEEERNIKPSGLWLQCAWSLPFFRACEALAFRHRYRSAHQLMHGGDGQSDSADGRAGSLWCRRLLLRSLRGK